MGRITRRGFLVGVAASAAVGAVRGVPFPASARATAFSDTEVFAEGVASGDPSTDGVVLWTRVDPERFHGHHVVWEVFASGDPSNVLAGGTAVVDGGRDGTIHVPVAGLPSGAELRYRFAIESTSGVHDITGTTRTLPSDPKRLRIGVVSCGKLSDGYFHAYRDLATMGCDVVLHLGDYIYASASGGDSDPLGRWGTLESRRHDPDQESRDLAGYRARYRQYRADPALRALHRAVPIVPVWDDNDIANNAYAGGNQAGETGDVWAVRKRAGQQAWSEYLPTRVGSADPAGDLAIWRRIRSGNLLDLFMLDTRLQRDQQVSNAAAGSTAANDDPERTMLGQTQHQWLVDNLTAPENTAEVAWRVVGQGVVMAHWRVVGPPERIGRLRHEIPLVRDTAVSHRLADGGVYWNSDGWDGYTQERARLFDTFASTGPVVVLTGDVHSSWANELVPDADPLNDPVGVEFVAPAASTRPFSSNVYGATPAFEAAFTAANPWIKFCDMDANGFLVVDLEEERAVARWYAVDARRPEATSSPLAAWITDRDSRRVLPYIGD